MFPEFENPENAGLFWKIFRNGMLHGGFPAFPKIEKQIENEILSQFNEYQIDHSIGVPVKIVQNAFVVNPKLFAERTVEYVEANMARFIDSSNGKPSIPKEIITSTGMITVNELVKPVSLLHESESKINLHKCPGIADQRAASGF